MIGSICSGLPIFVWTETLFLWTKLKCDSKRSIELATSAKKNGGQRSVDGIEDHDLPDFQPTGNIVKGMD